MHPKPVPQKKRLILTSQLIQQLLPAIPATILRGQAVSTYGSATYTLSMLTLRDACSMVASLSSSYNSCSPVEDENNPSEQTSAKKMEDRVSKVVEVFAGRIQKMENDFISLNKRASTNRTTGRLVDLIGSDALVVPLKPTRPTNRD
ncbi:hypothetical protein ZEAMMB73_Zm00001d053092 [Zea mays]|uniref:Uncharacterized protein n=1 Tax=Zea mays TaxID=4577 RepID=A0A1D6QM31_MAIZE|nr:hypothetical protein ZEAMMB73_Zm00001d053092 [Zea mays]